MFSNILWCIAIYKICMLFEEHNKYTWGFQTIIILCFFVDKSSENTVKPVYTEPFWDQVEFENTKGVIRIHKSKKIRQHNGQMKNEKRRNNDLQNNTQKTKDRVTRTPLKTGGELRCSGREGSSCSTRGSRHVTLVTNPARSHVWGKDREVLTTSGTYPWWTFVFRIDRCSVNKSHKISTLGLHLKFGVDKFHCVFKLAAYSIVHLFHIFPYNILNLIF